MPKKQPQNKPTDDDGVFLQILAAAISCILLFIGAAGAYVVWHTSTDDNRAVTIKSQPAEGTPTVPQIRTIAQDGSVVYNLPCGMELTYYDSVPGDVTGRWRVATTSFGSAPSNYAAEYYNNVFSSDDEVHAICDPTLGTTTRIKVEQGLLFVDTLKYVDGEEKDAEILFSGDVLRSKVFDKETGKSVKVGQEEKPSPTPEEENAPQFTSPSQSADTSVDLSPTQSVKPSNSQTPTPTPSNTPQTPAGNDRDSKFASGQVLATTESDNGGDPVYHTKNCMAAQKIDEGSELWYSSEKAAIDNGRRICGNCD